MNVILVQMSERSWTMQALHLACAVARNGDSQVVLLRLMPVNHPGYLGTPFGNRSLTEFEYQDVKEYAATAEDYGIEMSLYQMQCVTLLDALADAAQELDANIVFAHVPESRIPYWHRFRVWNLERRLSSRHCRLFTLDRPDLYLDRALSIEVEAMNMTEVR